VELPARRVEPFDAGASVVRDAPLGVPRGRLEHDLVGVRPGEDAAEEDAVVRPVRLLAEDGDVVAGVAAQQLVE
jgi:hypothetical protein